MNFAEQAALKMRVADVAPSSDGYAIDHLEMVVADLCRAPEDMVRAVLPTFIETIVSHLEVDADERVDNIAQIDRLEREVDALRDAINTAIAASDRCLRQQQDDEWERAELINLISSVEDQLRMALDEI